MKKNIGICLTVLVAILFLTSASRPSVDGRAVVADEGVLPSGMFAKSVGYLPGDSVVVTNPATGMSLDVMILGSISSTEGIAIMLSPEAATKLFITKGSNIQVKVTKKASSYDEDSKGGILPITNAKVKKADPDKDPEEAIPETVKESVADQKITPPTDDIIITESTVTEPAITESIITETTESKNEIPVITETLTTEPVIIEPAIVDTVIAETTESEDEIPVIAEALSTESVITESVTTEPVLTEPVITEPVIAETTEVEDEIPIIAEIPATVVDEADVVTLAEPIVEEVVDEEEISLVELEELTIPDVPSVAESEDVPSDIVAEEEIAVAEISPLAPILLVPVDDNPPPVAEIEDVPEVASTSYVEEDLSKEEVVVEEKLPVETIPSVAYVEPESETTDSITCDKSSVLEVPPVANAAVEDDELAPIVLEPLLSNDSIIVSNTASVDSIASIRGMNDYTEDSNVVKNTSELKTNAFYIQIAVYKDENNIRNLENKYGDKYPLSFVKLNDEKIQAMIGPLSVDEYETVLLRFRKNGFKDAFVRKF